MLQIFVILGFLILFFFISSRLLSLAYSTNLGLLCMPHTSIEPLIRRPFRRTAEWVVLVIYLESGLPFDGLTQLSLALPGSYWTWKAWKTGHFCNEGWNCEGDLEVCRRVRSMSGLALTSFWIVNTRHIGRFYYIFAKSQEEPWIVREFCIIFIQIKENRYHFH